MIEVLDKHPSLAVALASIISALLSAIITLGSTFIIRSSEEKRRREALAIQTGIEAFKSACEFAKHSGGPTTLAPQEMWILSSLKFMEVLDLKKMDEKTIVTKLKECISFSNAVEKVLQNNNEPKVST